MELTTTSGTLEGMSGNGVGAALAPVDSDQFSRALLSAMLSFRGGGFATRLPSHLTGVQGKIADACNDIVALSERRERESSRVTRTRGKEGKLKKRMTVP